jgi:hypothetical protein
MRKLYTAQTANDTTKANAFKIPGNLNGAPMGVHAFGTWDTATLTVYLSNNGAANGVALSELVFNADGFVAIASIPETTMWGEVSGVGAGTVLNLFVSGAGGTD